MTSKKPKSPKKQTKKGKTPARRSKPTPEELTSIEPRPHDPGILSKSRSNERKHTRLFKITYAGGGGKDFEEYHEILNNRDRYVILDAEQTWDKDKGSTLGVTILLSYVDRFSDPDKPKE